MKSSPTPRARFIAVIAVVVVVGGGLLVLLNTKGSSNSAKSHLIRTRTSTGATTPTTKTTGTTGATKTTTAKPKPKPKRKPKPKPKPFSVSNEIDAALLNHPVVVVSLYAPDVATDTQAMNEAKAGAAAVDAGFVAVNVFDETQARQLSGLIGTDLNLTNPEVLFFKRPRKLAFELQGFVDSEVVAQEASNLHPTIEFWVSEANGICAHYSILISAIGTYSLSTTSSSSGSSSSDAQIAKNADKAAGLFGKEAQALSKVRAVASKAASFAQFIALLQQTSSYASSEANALSRGDRTGARAFANKAAALVATMNALVSKLQLPSCTA